MEDQLMDCMSVVDVAACVVNILLRPSAYLCRDLALTADKLSVRQITDVLNKHFSDRKFTCPKVQNFILMLQILHKFIVLKQLIHLFCLCFVRYRG